MKLKYILILIIVIILVGGGIFLLTRKEDPLVKQAKEEIRQANQIYLNFENQVNAIPNLEFSSDVKNDFKMEAAFFGVFGKVKPGIEGLPPEAMPSFLNFFSALEARSSAKLQVTPDDPFERFAETSIKIEEVTREDLSTMEKLANTFDEMIKGVKANTPTLSPLLVERNKKTEKYFLEFDRINQRLKALLATLDKYSSNEFRSKIDNLKSANKVFGEVSQYTFLLMEGKAWFYSLNISKTFPEVTAEEEAVKSCARWGASAAPAGCEPIGFMPGKFQPLLLKLETIYSNLID